MTEKLTDANIAQGLDAPQPKLGVVDPFDEAEIRLLLRMAANTSEHVLQLRDKAIILFLLDTGVRASELCGLQISHVDLKEGDALVRGKGRLDKGQGKERRVIFGASARLALRAYLLHSDEPSPKRKLFVTQNGKKIDRRHLSTHLRRLGLRAGVEPCYPHRFRHTFAIMYLRNGGDIYTLQRLLGHSSLDMVKRYLAIAQTDIESAHRRAGPVDNLGL